MCWGKAGGVMERGAVYSLSWARLGTTTQAHPQGRALVGRDGMGREERQKQVLFLG